MKALLGQIRWPLSLIALAAFAILSSSCIQSNNYPIISSLETENNRVAPSGNSGVKCVASDPDGDSLTYAWSATGGIFSGEGPDATWLAPHAPGTYAITVKVTDGRGGEATAQLTIDVQVNHPPAIESLTAEPPEVRKSKTSVIKCVASDPDGDELTYLWEVAEGNVSEQGVTVTWTAPNRYGSYVIRVTVSDSRGGEASRELSVRVTCCPGK